MSTSGSFVKLGEKFFHPTHGYRHLFAYSAGLMAEGELRSLCPEPELLAVAYHESRRLVINRSGDATIVPRKGFRVYGLLWRVPEIGMAALDIHQGVPNQWNRFGALANLLDGRRATTEFYASTDRSPGVGAPEYLDQLMEIGRRFGFPAEYLTEISRWAQPQDVDAQRRHA